MRKHSFSSSHTNLHPLTFHANTNTEITGIVNFHQDADLSVNSRDGPIYTFQSCTFSNLINTGDGGAITCSASFTSTWKPQLIIKQSTFNSCNSSLGFGGGVYVSGISLFSVEKACFSNCNSVDKQGGGFYFTSGVGLPLLSESSFISCYARNTSGSSGSYDDAGGIAVYSSFSSTELHYLLESCRFISCGCYDWGGGGHIGVGSAQLGCKDCLFSACKCSIAEGLGINLATTDSIFYIRYCFFSCTNRANCPTDLSFNRDAGALSNSPILHSFSTKNPAQSVNFGVRWTNYQPRNWLPQANINAKLTATINGYRHNAIHSVGNNNNDYILDLL